MANGLDPILVKDFTEAKADLARHGIVIIRAVETDLEPAILAEVKNSIASQPTRLRNLEEGELDGFLQGIRKAAMKSSADLRGLYVRLLSKLGTEYVPDLVGDLEGIGELFKWERVEKAVGTVNARLERKGFRAIALTGPETLSDDFAIELVEKWPASFSRFRELSERIAKILLEQENEPEMIPKAETKPKKQKKKG
jgi:hypothetical protein